jgi:integrase
LTSLSQQPDSGKNDVDYSPELPSPWKAAAMARRRYQKGSVIPRGDSWELRWKEDVIENGELRRVHRSKSISNAEFPTKRLARRELDRLIEEAGINDETYRPSVLRTFHAFAEEWKQKVVSTMSVSTQASFTSELRAWDNAFQIPSGGKTVSMLFREIDNNKIQTVISGWNKGENGFKKAGEKTIKNRVGTLRLAWKWAREWGYTRALFTMETLRLPYWDREEAKAKRPAYSVETVREIMKSAEYPRNLVWWLTFETHARRGEICGLDVGHVKVEARIVTIRRNKVNKSVVKNTKARKPRVFSISAELAEALRPLVEGRDASEPLFLSPEGKRLNPENLVKRELKPLLKKLGIYVKGTACHGFRHGAATKLDELGTPWATRLQRLGHADPNTTMGYTHAVNEEDRKVSAAFGALLSQAFSKNECAKEIPQQLSLQLFDSEPAA